MKKLVLGLLVLTLVIAVLSLGWAAQASAHKMRAPFGIQVATMTHGLAAALGVTYAPGVIVLKVAPNSPAAQAGLQDRDIITAVNGFPITSVRELLRALKGVELVRLTVNRGGTEVIISISRQPPAELSPRPHPLEEWQSIEPQARFYHFLGGEFRFLDREGNQHTVQVIPGRVQSVAENSITILPNGQTETRTFIITERSRVPGRLEEGVRVLVITVDGSNEVRLVKPVHWLKARSPFLHHLFRRIPPYWGDRNFLGFNPLPLR